MLRSNDVQVASVFMKDGGRVERGTEGKRERERERGREREREGGTEGEGGNEGGIST
jgi:hypothetical protein